VPHRLLHATGCTPRDSRKKRGIDRQQGFTLLELMIVLLLIALTTSLVVITMRHDVSTVVEGEARRFAALVEQMCQEGIVQGKLFALRTDGVDGYRFDAYSADGWQSVDDDDVLRPRSLPDDITLELQLPDSGGNGRQQYLVCGPDGALSSFYAVFRLDDSEYRVSTNEVQEIQVEPVRSD
jgi:type II secretion system protein H